MINPKSISAFLKLIFYQCDTEILQSLSLVLYLYLLFQFLLGGTTYIDSQRSSDGLDVCQVFCGVNAYAAGSNGIDLFKQVIQGCEPVRAGTGR